MDDFITSPLLRLPAEIRIQIYGYLLVPAPPPPPAILASAFLIGADQCHSYERTTSGPNGDRTLHIRVIDPHKPNSHKPLDISTFRRSKCLIRTDRFRARTMQTTYTATNNLGIEPRILATCRQIHTEAAPVLYAGYTFDFDTHVEAISAFLADLTPLARQYVRSVSLVKSATPYDREFDRCEWDAATNALCRLPAIRTLSLGIIAGRPGVNGWDGVPMWTKEDFGTMVKWRAWAGFEWVRGLARVHVREGGEVKVRPIVEHCPMPSSESMAFWVGVSRNVEGGFGEWIEELVMKNNCET